MSLNRSQTTNTQTGQENLGTQLQNKVSEFGERIQEKTAGEHLDTAIENTKSAVGKVQEKTAGEHLDTAIKNTKTTVGEKMAQAGDALHDKGEEMAPKEDKSLVDKVKEGFANLTGANKEEKPPTVGEKLDTKLEDGKQAMAENLSKAGETLKGAGDKAQDGESGEKAE